MALPAGLGLITLALLATRSLRADGVAVLALAAAILSGFIPADRALAGFASPVVVTIAAFAILADAVHRSGIVDAPRSALVRRWRLTTPVLIGSGLLVALLAAISGRVSTRAALLRLSRLPNTVDQESRGMLMLNLACLLGGAMTVVGSVPNLLASAIRSDQLGAPFTLLAFLPVGAVLLVTGLLLFALVSILTRRTAESRSGSQVDPLRRVKSFATEIVLPPGSPLAGTTIAALEATGETMFHVAALVREDYRRIDARPDWTLTAGDVVVLDWTPSDLHRLIERYGLQPADGPLVGLAGLSGVAMVEAVITQSSSLIGLTPLESPLIGHGGVRLLGIGRNDDHPRGRLRRTRLRAGDILVLAAETEGVPQTLAALGCLLLADRRLRLGGRRWAALPLVALAAAALGFGPLWLPLLAGVLGAGGLARADAAGSL